MRLLKEDKVSASLKILEVCSELSNGKRYGLFPHINSLNFNLLACCYRRVGKLDTALKYLEKALAVLTG